MLQRLVSPPTGPPVHRPVTQLSASFACIDLRSIPPPTILHSVSSPGLLTCPALSSPARPGRRIGRPVGRSLRDPVDTDSVQHPQQTIDCSTHPSLPFPTFTPLSSPFPAIFHNRYSLQDCFTTLPHCLFVGLFVCVSVSVVLLLVILRNVTFTCTLLTKTSLHNKELYIIIAYVYVGPASPRLQLHELNASYFILSLRDLSSACSLTFIALKPRLHTPVTRYM